MEKNKIMMIVIIVLLLLLIFTIVGLSVYAINFLGKESEALPEEPAVVTFDQSTIDLIKMEDSMYTNLATGADGKEHVIRIKLSLAVDITDKKASAAFIELLNSRDVVIKDVVVGVLRSKTYEELSEANATRAQEVLREEILSNLQQEFNSNMIVTVYIDDLFIQ